MRRVLVAHSIDQLREADVHRIGALPGAVGGGQTGSGGGTAQRPCLAGGAEAGEEDLVEGSHLDHPLSAGIHPGQDCLAAVSVDNGPDPVGDQRERLLPARLAEFAAAFDSSPDERMEDPIGVVDPIEETVDLGAQFALRVGMIAGCREA